MKKNSKEEAPMEEVYQFLKACGTYYLATMDGEQPRVRPFGTIDIFNGQLTIQTGRKKDVAKQMLANPKVELCAFDGQHWLRLAAKAVEVPDIAAQKHMLDAYPSLHNAYAPGDGNTMIFALTEATATFSSFTEPSRTVNL